MTTEEKIVWLNVVNEITALQMRVLGMVAKNDLLDEETNLILEGSVKLTQATNKIMEAVK